MVVSRLPPRAMNAGSSGAIHPHSPRSCSLSRPRFSGLQHLSTSPETKFGGRSSDAVQAYAREGAEHGKRRGLPSPGNLAERSLSDPSRCTGGVLKALLTQHLKTARPPPRMGPWSVMIFAFGHSAPTVCYRFRKLFNNTKPISAPLGTDFREGIEAR
jgi:hypothetical protein